MAIIIGQVNGLAKMIEDERYCPDILTQVAAIRVALEKLGAIVVAEHIEYCVLGGTAENLDESKMTSSERIEEVRTALMRLLR